MRALCQLAPLFVGVLILVRCGADADHTTSETGECPGLVPLSGPCSGVGTCHYSGCLDASCVEGSWKLASVPGCQTTDAGSKDSGLSLCPQTEPVAGAPCGAEGSICEYPGSFCCGPLTATCVGGAWSVPIQEGDCEIPGFVASCPSEKPAPGGSCVVISDCAHYYLTCAYDECGQAAATIATLHRDRRLGPHHDRCLR